MSNRSHLLSVRDHQTISVVPQKIVHTIRIDAAALVEEIFHGLVRIQNNHVHCTQFEGENRSISDTLVSFGNIEPMVLHSFAHLSKVAWRFDKGI